MNRTPYFLSISRTHAVRLLYDTAKLTLGGLSEWQLSKNGRCRPSPVRVTFTHRKLVWETDAIVQPVMYYPRFLFHGIFLLHCIVDRHRLHNERNQNQATEGVLRHCGRGIYGIKPLCCGIVFLFSSQLHFMLLF